MYDKYGKEALGDGQNRRNPFDIFSELFGMRSDGSPRNPNQADDKVVKLQVTLADLYMGNTKEKSIERAQICELCKGVGSENKAAASKCADCDGQGVVLRMVRQGPMVFQMQAECPTCHGAGTVIEEKDKCTKCVGKKVLQEKKTFQVQIPKGSQWNDHVSFFGEADQVPDMQTGRLVFVLVPKKGDKSMFKREKNDLWVLAHKVPVFNALTSYTFNLTHLDGRQVVLQTKGVIQPNAVMKVTGLGMPVKNSPGDFGDLYINFKVVLPDTGVTPEQAAILSKILPVAPAVTIDETSQPHALEKVDHPEEDEYDDEEEDEDAGHHGHSHTGGHGHSHGGHGGHSDDGSHDDDGAGEGDYDDDDDEHQGPGQSCAPQ